MSWSKQLISVFQASRHVFPFYFYFKTDKRKLITYVDKKILNVICWIRIETVLSECNKWKLVRNEELVTGVTMKCQHLHIIYENCYFLFNRKINTRSPKKINTLFFSHPYSVFLLFVLHPYTVWLLTSCLWKKLILTSCLKK